jgi:hypothetical protein
MSHEELQAKVVVFIEYFSTTMAKPFKWTYGRKSPLCEAVYRKSENTYNT